MSPPPIKVEGRTPHGGQPSTHSISTPKRSADHRPQESHADLGLTDYPLIRDMRWGADS